MPEPATSIPMLGFNERICAIQLHHDGNDEKAKLHWSTNGAAGAVVEQAIGLKDGSRIPKVTTAL